jgi:Ca2+-binding EF-hand superfamily protein
LWRKGKDWRRAFEEDDRSGDGIISTTSFKQALMDIGASLNSKEMREVIQKFDPNNRGRIKYVPFLREMAPSSRRGSVVKGMTKESDTWRAADKLRTMIRQRARDKDGNLRDPYRHFARSKTSFDLHDFKEGLMKLNLEMDRRVVEELYQMMDSRKNGTVRFSEFAMFVTGSRYTDAEDKLRALITQLASSWDGGAEIKRAFARFDRDDKGYINASDFRNALSEGGFGLLNQRESEDLVLRFDTNGDDRVSWREFVRFVEDRMRMHQDVSGVVDRIQKKLVRATRGDRKNPWSIFQDMDSDGNGVLDQREFGRGLQDLGVDLSRSELDKVMSYFDYNQSGYIGYANFADVIEGRHPGGSGSSSTLSSSSSSSSTRRTNRRQSVSLTRVMDRLTDMVKSKARDGRKYDLKRPFRHFDVNSRGKISTTDFENGLRKLDFDLTRKDVEELLEHFDIENDGMISFHEFCDVIEGRKEGDLVGSTNSKSTRTEKLFIRIRREIRNHWKSGKDYRVIFEEFDRSHKGTLSSSDFKKCMIDLNLQLSREEVRQIMTRFENSSNGMVNYEEFLREMSPSRRRRNGISNQTDKAADRLRTMIRQRAKSMNGNLRDPFRHFAQRRSSFALRDFEEGLRKLEFKLKRQETEELFLLLDVTKNGEVRFSEFSMFVTGTRYTDAEDKLRHAITRMARDWDGGRNLKRAFERMDRNDKGYISARDFESALRSEDGQYGFTKESISGREVRSLLLKYDTNGDDRISYREFLSFVDDRMRKHGDMKDVIERVKRSLRSRNGSGGDPWRIFHEMDSDGNGVLDKREFGRGLSDILGEELSSREMDKVMSYFDYNHSGYVGYSDFADVVEESHGARGGYGTYEGNYGSSSSNNNLKSTLRGNDPADKLSTDLKEVVMELRAMIQERRPGDEDYRQFFDRFDQDHSGIIESDELKRGLRKMGFRLTSRQTDGLIDEFGTSNGRLKYYQFLKMLTHGTDEIDLVLQKMSDAMRDERINMRDEFRRMDRDKRGYLSRREFARGLKDLGIFRLTDSDVRRVMDRFDKDNDGRIDYREFRKTLEDSERALKNNSGVRNSSSSRAGGRLLEKGEISFSGKPSKRGLRSEEAISMEVIALRLKSAVLNDVGRGTWWW